MFTISLLSGLALCSFYSKLIFKKINLINIILSAFIITAPIQLIAFLEAKLIAPYIYILFAIFATSILLKIKFTYRYIKKAFNLLTEFAIKKENIFINLISLLLTLFLTYKLFPNVWRFEDHDILYFGWLNGIFNDISAGEVLSLIVVAGLPLVSANVIALLLDPVIVKLLYV